MAMIRSSIGLYFRYSVAATAAVVALPLVIVIGVALSVSTGTPILVAVAVGAGVSVAAALVGSYLWRRRPESMDVCFGELMIWSFIRRRRAEHQIEEGAEILGLDGGGKPLRRMQLTKKQRLKILHDLAAALETKDPYTHGHSTRVEELVAQTAVGLDLTSDEITELRTAASLHDVGKIRVPNRILRKPDRLTIDEQLIVQEHSSVGAWMVAGVSNLNIVASVRHHHERWDGNGYPDGLSGRDIPLFARVIAVADAYDAMTSTRPYRPSMSRQQAIEEIERGSGEQFDPEVVDAFMATVPRRVPLAALVGLGFAGRFLRRGTAWAARYGSGSVAPGVASVGAASVLIASLFSPPVALTKPTPEAGSGVSIAEEYAEGSEMFVEQASSSRDERSHERQGDRDGYRLALVPDKGGSISASARGGTNEKGDANHVLAGTIHRPRRNGDAPGGSDSRHSGNPPGEVPPGDPPPKDPPPTDTPPTVQGDGGEKEKQIHTDPQPERGRDCVGHPGRGGGGGNARHCG